MNKDYCIIKNDVVKNKVEALLSYYGNLNKPSWTVLFDNNQSYSVDYYKTIYRLKHGTTNYSVDILNDLINDFLNMLLINSDGASGCLEEFLDVMISNVSSIKNEDAFKRLFCVLYVVYWFQYLEGYKSVIIDTNDINYLKKEEKELIFFIFIEAKNYIGFVNTFYSFFDNIHEINGFALELSNILTHVIKVFSARIEDGAKTYDEFEWFITAFKSLDAVKGISPQIPQFPSSLEYLLLTMAFATEKKEVILVHENQLNELKQIDKNIVYYYARFYLEESKKNGTNCDDYIKKANDYINEALSNFKPTNSTVKFEDVIEEKLHILSEMGDFEIAYNEMKSINNKGSRFFYYILIICAKYLTNTSQNYSIENINDVVEYLDSYYQDISESNSRIATISNDKSFSVIEKFNEIISETNNDFQNEIDGIILHGFSPIIKFVYSDPFMKKNKDIRTTIYSQLLILMSCAKIIISKSTITDVSNYQIVYYTKANNLRLLLEDENDSSIHYRMPLFHSNHMNDPEEGKVFNLFLKKGNDYFDKSINISNKREKYEENYIFLKSFFYIEKDKFNEFLPMWVQYGNDAKGVCVILDGNTFEKADLLKVNYIDANGNCENNDIGALIQRYKIVYDRIIKICNNDLKDTSEYEECREQRECREKILDLTEYINSYILFLFKHKSYEHESEARIIVTKSSSELDDVKTIPGDVPKMYIYSDYQTYIDEIILGSKMEIPDNFVPFIHYHGKKMWINNDKKKQITVSKSQIQYR